MTFALVYADGTNRAIRVTSQSQPTNNKLQEHSALLFGRSVNLVTNPNRFKVSNLSAEK
jgi:hypothetical protein